MRETMRVLCFLGQAALLLLPAISAAVALPADVAPNGSCKCISGDKCWPSEKIWALFNSTVGGNLIRTQPVAVSCYPGPSFNPAECAAVDANWANATFQADDVVGLSFPTNITCPPVNVTAGASANGTCTLGVNPSYAVNCTNPRQVARTIAFSKLFNLRLVVKNTGHDQLGRSEGSNGLEIWIRHLRNGIAFQGTFKSSTACNVGNWTGSAFKIAGGYTWGDVGAEAQKHNVVVVNGGTPSVGAIGGWMQGGGHGPASRTFGLGADQVLELEVVLADGNLVTANACRYSDLFFALRGGGGGTYGVVVSSTVKAYAMVNVTVQHLAMFPLSANISGLLDAIAVLYSSYPDLNDAGYAGYGQWSVNSPAPLFADVTTGYVHGFSIFNTTVTQAQSAFDAARARLAQYNLTSIFISETYASYPDYWTYYQAESGVEPPVGSPAYGAGNRLFDRASVTQNFSALRTMIQTIAGTPEQFTTNNLELVGGGQVFRDASDPFSGVTPAWRLSYLNNIVARVSSFDTPQSVLDEKQHDITYVKVPAMKKLAPNTGAYMNEGDRFDPDWKVDFYGRRHYARLLAVKRRYDPRGLFYCPTCVGSDAFEVVQGGRLCRARGGYFQEQDRTK
ncbi:FAD/FMN-containing protein [Fonsecaea erecta]|uniref:FAD/FMN-containing protein n=1 Tax=Fonsecaea erecta TaxID=1367422 RepID=A0A178ZGS7_9EURO|nr:FAD/FMN-containing protein [Fonsecaea erecta]OAP58988.1 FAD/FMN-containing protein [Fonsecaea erecta]